MGMGHVPKILVKNTGFPHLVDLKALLLVSIFKDIFFDLPP
jgi:hypothetical protein